MAPHPCSPLAVPCRAQLLSNGRYSVLLTGRGGGYSSWRDLALTRWREDPTCDDWGSHLLLRDVDNDVVWSAAASAHGSEPARCSVDLAPGRARFEREDGTLTTALEVAVAPGHDAEVRRVSLTNRGAAAREIELTSYAELVLGSASGDAAHPAFSKMFIQTDWVEEAGVLLATRRRRAPDEASLWAAHFACVDPPEAEISAAGAFESGRARFLGRGRTLRNAHAMQGAAKLSNTAGCVLDAVFSLRRRVRVAAGARASVSFWTVAADSCEDVLAHCAALRAPGLAQEALHGARARADAANAKLGVDAAAAARHAQLIAPLLYADPAWRAPAAALARGHGGPPTLWAGGISGDRPIALLHVGDLGGLGAVADLLLAQRSWQARWLGVDVVVLITATHAADALEGALQASVDAQKARLAAAATAKADVFLLREDRISAELRDGLATAARLVLDAGPQGWSRAASTNAAPAARPAPTPSKVGGATRRSAPVSAAAEPPVVFGNGYGGFSVAGRKYVVELTGTRCTPAPWINVIANAEFGFLVSCEGGGYSWSINSQQNALTPWPNDPVSDNPHDVLYVRDEDSGEFWSATALPIRVEAAVYTAAHGKGCSRFGCDAHGLELDLLQFVPRAGSLKLSRLRLRNRSGRLRRLSITAYVEWALAPNGVNAAPFVVTSLDDATGALFARNAWRPEFGERVAFLDLGGAQSGACGDRAQFLGAGGAVGWPAALVDGAAWPGRVGAGLDPCGALRASIELAADTEMAILCLLGDAPSEPAARALIDTWRAADLDAALQDVTADWNDLLDTVQVRTPDAAVDLLLNDWLPYQTLACRVWARTAYYQASGAYGFRDQLQDVMALCVARPQIARAQIVRAASRQFVEGDVQHWWLPPSGRGIRTRMTDDRIWLVWVAMHYVDVSGDTALLEEDVPFIEGPMLKDGEDDAFFQPGVSAQSASLYEHCARALDVSLALGAHDLPLIGTGDWNDGMNRVGAQGRGESVWLGWFLVASIDRFVPQASARGDDARIARWQACAAKVAAALEGAGWDGTWYRRGYYDDGTPLGSSVSLECRIDQIAQSWSVLCGRADPVQAARAMAAVDQHLVWRAERIAPLLTPPFDVTPLDPGYIKGYPPGLRENGGQYTHGATWSIFAYAALGQGDQAGELFSILNPVRHGDSAAAIARYKVEPYVACGDVYSVDPLVGRGGWTWYTGSAAWLYRAGIEALLGFRLHGAVLEIDPLIPRDWPGFEIAYRRRNGDGRVTLHEISVENPARTGCGVAAAALDGQPIARADSSARGVRIALCDDGAVHRIRVVLGKRAA